MANFWVVAVCSLAEVYRRFRGTYFLHYQDDEFHRTSETSVNYQTTRRNNLEDSHLHTRCRENLKSHNCWLIHNTGLI
jgi:hypothetical protein